MRLVNLATALALVATAATAAPRTPVHRPAKIASNVPGAKAVPVGPKAAEELAAVWRDVCLNAFPADDALTALAASRGFRVMTEAGSAGYLHDQPGRGWFYRTQLANYEILVQTTAPAAGAPTCSVRRMTPNGMPSGNPFFAARDDWAAHHTGTLQPLDPQQDTRPDGTSSEGIGSAFVDPAGHTTDLFLAIVTEHNGTYHGHDPAAARGGPGIEVRLVHTLGQPA